MAGSQYTDWRSTALVPSWLQRPWGLKYNRTLGYVSDLLMNAAAQAVGARFLATCPNDALPYAGADRSMPAYPIEYPGASAGATAQAAGVAAYRARLLKAWSTWSTAGTLAAVQGQLEAFGFANVAIYTADGSGPPGVVPWPPDSNTANWSRFWVVLTEPFPSFLNWKLTTWGDGRTWGENGPDGTAYTWGSTATVAQVTSIRALIRKWKPVHAICAGIWIDYASAGTTLQWLGS